MTALDVGKKLVALCGEGKSAQAMKTLYDPDIISVEAAAAPGQPRETRGLAACEKKGEEWRAGHEIHSASAEGPFPHDDRFAVFFRYEVTDKKSGTRLKLDEVALYTVKDGKVVREEFFYAM